MTEAEIRDALVHYSRETITRKLSNATAGNMSIRGGRGMFITPTSVPPEAMTADQMVDMALDGTHDGAWRPSSEWALHARLYQQRPEIGAVVHAHPLYCVALSCLRQPIPPFHYMVAGFGGTEVPCARYETFGTIELADAVAETMGTRLTACLMANHGMIAVGRDLAAAFARTEKLEVLAQQYQMARATGGEIVMLTEAEMQDVIRSYTSSGYGDPRRAAAGT